MRMLNAHKGTVVRVILEYEDGGRTFIQPLNDSIGGLVFDAEKFNHISRYSAETNGMLVFGEQCLSVGEFPNTSAITRVETFVIYPDGTTWQGSIGKEIRDPIAFLWSDQAIQGLKNKEVVSNFYGEFDWRSVPTTLMLFGELDAAGTCGTQHACGTQCD